MTDTRGPMPPNVRQGMIKMLDEGRELVRLARKGKRRSRWMGRLIFFWGALCLAVGVLELGNGFIEESALHLWMGVINVGVGLWCYHCSRGVAAVYDNWCRRETTTQHGVEGLEKVLAENPKEPG